MPHIYLSLAVLTVAMFGCHVYGSICLDVPGGLWVRDPDDCQVAYQCGIDEQVSQQVRCNESQIWSKMAFACVWEYDPERDDCNGNPQRNYAVDARCILKTGNNPDPEDCSRFISCQNGTLIAIQKCGAGTLYFPRNDSCEFAHVVASGCGGRQIPETMTIGELDPVCAGKNDVVADPTSCVHFYQCQAGRQVMRHRCPPKTFFSPKSLKCEWNRDGSSCKRTKVVSTRPNSGGSPPRKQKPPPRASDWRDSNRDRDYQFGSRRDRRPFQ